MAGYRVLVVVILAVIFLTAGSFTVSGEDRMDVLELWHVLQENNPSYRQALFNYNRAREEFNKPPWEFPPVRLAVEPTWDLQQLGGGLEAGTKGALEVDLPLGGVLRSSANVQVDWQGNVAPGFSLTMNWPLLQGPDLSDLEKELAWLRAQQSYRGTVSSLARQLLNTYQELALIPLEREEKELELTIREKELARAKAGYEAGEISLRDLEASEEAYLRALSSLEDLERQNNDARTSLFFLLGGLEVETREKPLLAEPPALPEFHSLLKRAFEHRLDINIMLLEAEREVMDLHRKEAQAGIVGELNLNYSYRGGTPDPHAVLMGIGFSWIFFDGRGTEVLESARFGLEITEKQLELKFKEIELDMALVSRRYGEALDELKRAEEQYLEALERYEEEFTRKREGYRSPYDVDQAYLTVLKRRNAYNNIFWQVTKRYLEAREKKGIYLELEDLDWLLKDG